MHEANKFIKECMESKGRVLLHCSVGKSRSCAIAVAFIMQSLRLPFDKALFHVSTHRPICAPNKGFVMQLKALEVELN